MVRKSRLIAALDAHKGKDYRLEKQKILQKNAAKRKRTTTAAQELRDDTLSEQGAVSNGVGLQLEKDSDAWESDKSREALNIVHTLAPKLPCSDIALLTLFLSAAWFSITCV